jgi:hypothetical protein
MRPELLLESFESQFRKMETLVLKENVCRGVELGQNRPQLNRALTFAEWLMMCPTIEQAESHIKQDRAGARDFHIFACQISGDGAEKLSDVLAPEVRIIGTPFFVVAYFVQHVLNQTMRDHPDFQP